VVQAAGQEEAASGEEDDELIAPAHGKGSKPALARRSSARDTEEKKGKSTKPLTRYFWSQ
jgi:hypothetical protein